MGFLRMAGVFGFAFALAVGVFAQDAGRAPETGAIEGSIHDTSGTPVGGAQVDVTDGADFGMGVAANEDGRYAFSDVPVGSYTVTISADGFKTFKKAGVKVQTGQVTEIDANLGRDADSKPPQAANHNSF
jgi:hypothetical protein